MKIRKNRWLILLLALSLVFSIQIISVLAENEEEGPVDGPIIPELVEIEYAAPTVGQTVGDVNKTFRSEFTTLKIDKTEWKDSSDKVLGNDDRYISGEKYQLYLTMSLDGGYITEDTTVKLNGKEMKYSSETGSDPAPNALFSTDVEPYHLDAPKAEFSAKGLDTGVLTKITSSMQYSTDGGASWIDCEDVSMELEALSEGEIIVVYKEDTFNQQHILVSRQNAPSGLSVVNCTTSANNDGKIKGVSKTMEYRLSTDTEYKSCEGNEITGLAPGQYFIRTKASGTSLSSGDVQQTVSKYSAKVPEIKTQPKSVTIETGQECTFTVKAENATKYEWHVIDIVTGKDYVLDPKEDEKYYKGFGTDTLTVLSINKLGDKETDCKYNGDRYYCTVSNEVGKVSSKLADYNVKHVATGDWQSDALAHWQICSCGAIINKASHVDTKNAGKCEVCGYELVAEEKEIKIASGANSTWQPGGTDGLVITVEEDLASFVKLMLDDQVVAEDDYDLVSGSTVITLHPDMLDKLETGNHVVTAEFKDGSVSTQLTVASNNTKNADDTESEQSTQFKMMNLLVVSAVIALALLIALIITIRKLKHHQNNYQHYQH